jgi:hypothetical protein
MTQDRLTQALALIDDIAEADCLKIGQVQVCPRPRPMLPECSVRRARGERTWKWVRDVI